MTLPAGARLGPYEIVSAIGAGGMGEVYRARDPRMGREVAIKVAAAQFSERFSREVHAVAALNHPHICTLYDVGPNYLVMELVEGPTLAERIGRGPVPLDEAIAITRQIAAALEAAHEKGIIHRDLKPANIKVTPEGTVKVLDFGLAKFAETESGGADRVGAGPVGDGFQGVPTPIANTQSPTLNVLATGMGVILGTAAYMAPEQARGQQVDKRADIWAFGVILHELVTGRRLFDGGTTSDVLASVLKEEPSWERVPAKVRPLLRRCLEKDPRRRLRDIGDAMAWIDTTDLAPVRAAPRRTSNTIAWVGCAACFLVAAGLAAGHFQERRAPAPQPVRFQIPLPEKIEAASTQLALSPDGRLLAIAARSGDGLFHRWIRSLDSLELRELPRTESDNATLFWSFDSRFLAFSARGQLRKIDVMGGPPQAVCDVPEFVIGGAWNRDGVIVFGTWAAGIFRVSASGGSPSPVTTLAAGHKEVGHFLPTFLPDGRHFLYIAPSGPQDAPVLLGSLDATPGTPAKQLTKGDHPAFVPSLDGTGGQLVFVRDGTLLAQPFDLGALAPIGDPVPIAESVASVSFSGTGVMANESNTAQKSRLMWVDRVGTELETVEEAGFYESVALSPDARLAAVQKRDDLNVRNLWIVDLAKKTSTRFTFSSGFDGSPVWSPDGSRIAFASHRGGEDLYVKALAGTTDETLLVKLSTSGYPTAWSRDGRFLMYSGFETKTKMDVWVFSFETRKSTRLLATEFDEQDAFFSPDGRWIAYGSDESGRLEVYARPFSPGSSSEGPSVGPKVLVSKGGGIIQKWRGDGKELLYLSEGNLMGVPVSGTFTLSFGEPKVVRARTFATQGIDFTDDGRRALVALRLAHDAPPQPISVVLNWQAALKR